MADNFHLKAIVSAVDKVSPALRGINHAAKATRKALRDIGRAGGELMGKIGLPLGLSLGALAYGVKSATSAILDYGGAVQDASDKTGVAAGMLQAYRFGAEQAGVGAEELDEALVKLNKGLAEAAAGKDKGFAALMAKMKIPLRDAKGDIISVAEAMPQIANAFEKTTDPALRTRMAMELFGKSGAKLIPWLKEGKGGLMEMLAEAERLGIGIDDKAIGALDRFGDELGKVRWQVRAQWGRIVGEITPMILPLVKGLQEWIAANKEMIRAEVGQWITGIAQGLKQIDWKEFRAGLVDTWRAVSGFVKTVGGMKNVFIGLGIAFLAGPLSALLSIGGAVARLGVVLGKLMFSMRVVRESGIPIMIRYGGALAALAAVNPVILGIAAAIGLIAVGAILVWRNWEKVSVFFSNFWENLGSSIGYSWGYIAGATLTGVKAVSGLVIDGFTALLGFISSMADWWAGVLSAVWNDPMRAAIRFFEWIFEKFNGIIDLVRSFGTLFSGSASGFSAGFADATGGNRAGAAGVLPAAAGGRTNLQGDMTVRFENAPPGMRAEQGRTNQPGVGFNPDVGYRSFATGAP